MNYTKRDTVCTQTSRKKCYSEDSGSQPNPTPEAQNIFLNLKRKSIKIGKQNTRGYRSYIMQNGSSLSMSIFILRYF